MPETTAYMLMRGRSPDDQQPICVFETQSNAEAQARKRNRKSQRYGHNMGHFYVKEITYLAAAFEETSEADDDSVAC